MSDYKMEELAYEINLESAKLTKQACSELSTTEKPRFIWPNFTYLLALSPDVNNSGFRNVTFDELVDVIYI